MKALGRRCLKYVWLIFAALIILMAILINIGRLVVPLLNHQQKFFQQWASAALHQPVQIGEIKASWHNFEPELRFTDVTIQKPGSHTAPIRIKELAVGIDVLHSLLARKLLPGQLLVSGTKLAIYQNKSGRLIVKGVVNTEKQDDNSTQSTTFRQTIVWLLTQANVTVKNVDIHWYSSDGLVLPIKNLALKVHNGVFDHHISGSAKLAQDVSTHIKFIINLNSANLDEKKFAARVYLQANNVVVEQWLCDKKIQHYLHGAHIKSGNANFVAWSDWRNGQLQSLQTEIGLKHLAFTSVKTPHSVLINELHGNFLWQKYAHGWGLSADHLRLKINGDSWPESKFGYRVIFSHKGVTEHLLKLGFLRLQDVVAIAKELKIWPAHFNPIYHKLDPQGELKDIALVYYNWKKALLHPLQSLSFGVKFSGLSFNSINGFPGIKNITGTVNYSAHQGNLVLNSKDATVDVPQVYQHKMFFKKIKTQINWEKHGNAIAVEGKNIEIGDNDLHSSGSFTAVIPHHASPDVNISLHFSLQDVTKMAYYVPELILNKGLAKWLDDSFRGGSIQNGYFLLKGKLADFPFKNKHGEFLVSATLNDLSLLYHPDWPLLKHIDGEVHFADQGLVIRANHAKTAGISVDNISAVVPNLAHSVMTITGETRSTLGKGLIFLKETPLLVGKELNHVIFKGPMRSHIKLVLPFYENDMKVDSSGQIVFRQGYLALPKWDLQLKKLNGSLYFKNENLSGKNLSAQLYNEPIRLSVITLGAKTKQPTVFVETGGHIKVKLLQALYHFPFGQFYSGETDYRAILTLRGGNSSQGNSLNMISDLRGITISGLPAPYAKSAKQKRPFHFQIQMSDKDPLQIKASYGKLVNAALTYQKKKGDYHLFSGEISLDKPAIFQDQPGLLIAGNLPALNWQSWLKFFQKYFPHNELVKERGKVDADIKSQFSWLRAIELQIGEVHVFSQFLHHFYIKIMPRDKWIVNIQSKKIAGVLQIPYDFSQLWIGNFNLLKLEKFSNDKKGDTDNLELFNRVFDPHSIPPLKLTISDFNYNNKDYGRVHLITNPDSAGMAIKELTMQSPLFNLVLTGEWRLQNHQSSTMLEGSFGSRDIGELLNEWHVSKSVSGGNGEANFELDWQGPLNQFKMANLNGEVRINFRDGSILKLGNKAESELGLGKLLNLFSLQSIARRLTLNFSDLTRKGFVFNVFKGDFKLVQGNAYTQNAYLDGPVAKVKIKGRIGFAKENYGLQLQISPYVTSSLPLIVGIAGGPIAGAVTWVVNKIIEPEIGKVAGFTYRVTGSWSKPKIVKLEKKQKIRQNLHYAPVEERRSSTTQPQETARGVS